MIGLQARSHRSRLGKSLLEPARARPEARAQLLAASSSAGLSLERVLQARGSPRPAVAKQREQHCRAESTTCAIVGPELHGAVEGLQRRFMQALLLQRGAEAEKIVHRGSGVIGARDPCDALIELLVLQAEQAHQMKRVRVSRIACKGVLATALRLHAFAGADVPEGGLVELSGGMSFGRLRRSRGVAGGGPALMTVHLQATPPPRYSASSCGGRGAARRAPRCRCRAASAASSSRHGAGSASGRWRVPGPSRDRSW